MSLSLSELEELELILQDQYKKLLEQNNNFGTSRENNNSGNSENLPFYSTIFPIYESIDYKECLLLEIEEQIKERKQDYELKAICKQLSDMIRSDKACDNPLERWYQEMILYYNAWADWNHMDVIYSFVKRGIVKALSPRLHVPDGDDGVNSSKNDCVFYNIKYSKQKDATDKAKETAELLFSTRYCNRCLAMKIKILINQSTEDFEVLNCESSLCFKGVLESANDYLRRQSSAEHFVRDFLWKNIKILIDYV